ncbi:60S acidic ribosomal protein P1, partial [Salmonella sp. s51944]|uniref:60S acidic ribosomal protein P1 n=1 Tax=Salmonella sp. s51944 TaxID=3159655 RepID=UPI00398162FE
HDDEVAVTADKILTLVKAAKVTVEPYWPGLFAKSLDGMDIGSLVSNVGSGGGAAPAAGGGAAGGGEAEKVEEKEEKKESSESESDDDMGFGLFD